MDIATLLGLIGAMGVIIASMLMGGGVMVFVNPPSLMVVVGGSFMVVLSKFNMSQFLGALKVAGRAFKFTKQDHAEFIEEVVQIADAARKGGLLSLENMEISNPFMKKGILLLIDGHDADIVKSMLQKDMNLTFERHIWGQKVFRSLGDVAPAMGMIGTLVGLVLMLSNMEDPKSIGPAMAVALLTTLYGAMIANMLALPIADKLELRSDEELLSKRLVLDALMGIQAGQNPRVIKETLKNYLPPSLRTDDD